MTEADWNTCTDPQKMLEWLRSIGKLNERKARLFSVAVCRRIWPLLTDVRSRRAVEVAERYADEVASLEGRSEAEEEADEAAWQTECALSNAAMEAVRSVPFGSPVGDDDPNLVAARAATSAVVAAVANPVRGEDAAAEAAYALRTGTMEERTAQAALLRCVLGCLAFRPLTIDPSLLMWNEEILVKFALGIYDERAWDRLPILADALEEAGVTDETILSHCRGPGPHARGCFVVDLLLQRE